MSFNWKTIKTPIVGLSPMADMTDSPFSKIVKSISSPVIFREMVSAEAIFRKNEKTIKMAAFDKIEQPIIQQIFGADPEHMATAARIVEEIHCPDGIDINMGCPVYKITSNFNGSALMKDPKLATKIVKAMKAVITVPLSVKMRAGWSDPNECIEFAKVIENAGADLISIHGRTKIQAYSGKSNREVVAKVKEVVSIPVLYNGDIFEWEDFFSALEETKCDGALIGRGGLGNPWIFKQIEQKLNGEYVTEPTIEDRVNIVKQHLDLHLEHYGDKALSTFRKHLSWYFKGIPNFKEYKIKLMTTTNKTELDNILDDAVKHLT